ncbi:MAG TPA: hypothetical protein VHZ24_21785 [Pirellulales bacterium]|nr:hypothetical protein [Pirellulales bacterium]
MTLAVGPPRYKHVAANLARSFRRWHHDGSPWFAIAIDRPDELPSDVRA